MVQRQKEDGEGLVKRPGEDCKEKGVVCFHSEA